jgi:two-component sensor histidine kinase
MKFFIILLFACGLHLSTHAESFSPLLSKPAVDSLRAKLWQTPPGTIRLDLLLRLSAAIINQYPLSTIPFDSVYAYSRQAQVLSEKMHYPAGEIESNYAIGWLQVSSNQVEEGKKKISQAIAHSRQQHNLALEALGWDYLTRTVGGGPEGETQRLGFYAQALRCYRLLNDRAREAYTRKQIADVHLRQGKQGLARTELQQVVTLYRACAYPRLHYTYDLLAVTNTALANYQEALYYSLASIRVAKETRDTTLLAAFYHRAASIYQELNQLKEALAYDQLALRSGRQAGFPSYYCLELVVGIAKKLIALGQPRQALAQLLKERQAYPAADDYTRLLEAEGLTTCYLALKQYALATEQSQQLRSVLKTTAIAPNYSQQARAYSLLSKLYVATKHYGEARPYLTKTLALYKLLGNQAEMASMCLLSFKVDSAQGHYPAAISYYQRYKALNDSIFNEKTSRQVAGLQIQYDTKKKEQNIQLLTKQNQVQQAGLRQRELQRNATLGGAVLLTMLLGVSYNRSRIIKRSTHLLEHKQLEINQKNQSLEQVLGEKDELLAEKEELLIEKEGLIVEKEGLLVEKEWMLKEIHHRVKNNLQIVSELLDSQLDHLQEPRTLAIIRESQNRVQAMALVHQKLYQSQNLARVDMQEYIREIVEHLLASFHCEQVVREHLDIAAIELDVALATPLGLIINEAVTNSLKYAFPDSRRGTISISLSQLPDQRYQLTLADDGVGLPAGFALEASRTMGLTLIRGLSEQIEADLTFAQGQGVCISLAFESAKKAAHTETQPA